MPRVQTEVSGIRSPASGPGDFMKPVLLFAAAALFGTSPAVAGDPFYLSCDVLPATAVRTVPPPFDSYMDLACIKTGQALCPKRGFTFMFNEASMCMGAMNPDKPLLVDKTLHYTSLVSAPLSKEELRALRADLHKIANHPIIDNSQIIRMRIETSSGARKQVYLLIPTDGGAVQGMECVKDCKPIEEDPWFFTIVKE